MKYLPPFTLIIILSATLAFSESPEEQIRRMKERINQLEMEQKISELTGRIKKLESELHIRHNEDLRNIKITTSNVKAVGNYFNALDSKDMEKFKAAKDELLKAIKLERPNKRRWYDNEILKDQEGRSLRRKDSDSGIWR